MQRSHTQFGKSEAAFFIVALLFLTSVARAEFSSVQSTLRRLPPVVPTNHEQRCLDGDMSWLEPPNKADTAIVPSLSDLTGGNDGFRIVPYGAFSADMLYATQRTSPGAYSLFVFSREDQGEDAFAIDARRTRLGINVSGPALARLGNAESGGKVEIDFHGDFVTENRATILLRQAYWEIKNERFRLLVGQTWDVISPLYPETVSYANGLFAGNIGLRRTQFRAERYLDLSDFLRLTLQASLNQDIVTDFPTDPGVRREASDWPVVQARAALSLGARSDHHEPMTIGFSGHVGETGFDFLTAGPPPLNLPPEDDARYKTWSFNVDMRVPVTDRFGFQGEFFIGANLSAYLGGIGQGVCPCVRLPIRSTGGWAEVWYKWAPWLHSHLGFGLDDPNDRDFLFGRTYNQFIFANLFYDVTHGLTTGLEVSFWKTLYQETRAGQVPAAQLTPSEPGEAVTIDWMVKYSF